MASRINQHILQMRTYKFISKIVGLRNFLTAALTTLLLVASQLLVADDSVTAKPAGDAEREVAPGSITSKRNLIFREVGDVKLLADVFRPDDNNRHPGVLMIHGGAWSSGSRWNVHDHARELAQNGYVAVAIDYRLAPRCQILGQVEDCRAALAWLRDNADDLHIDTDHVALWGYSAGAHLACMLATKPAEDALSIQAVIAGGVPSDFSYIPEDSSILSMVMSGSRKEKPEVYEAVTPLNFVSKSTPPIFFYHGTHDLLVPQRIGRTMYDKLHACGVDCEFYSVEGQGHLITFIDPEARRRSIAFLNKHISKASGK